MTQLPETEIQSGSVADERIDQGSSPAHVPASARGGEPCSCSKCNLYRWYPPLLLLSTVMAGVFCWMYVTKPVFLAPSKQANPGAVQPAIKNSERGEADASPEPLTAEAARVLDPALAPPISGAPQDPVIPAAGIGAMKRLDSSGPRSGNLFVPVGDDAGSDDLVALDPSGDSAELSGPESGDEAEPTFPSSEGGELQTYLEDIAPATGLSGEVARGAVAVSFADQGPVASLEPSFMVDFLVTDPRQTLALDYLSAEERAVHWINQLTD